MTTPDPPIWTYSGDPTESQLDEVRFLLQDIDESIPLLSDLEIQYLIDKWAELYQSLTYVAAIGAAIVSRRFAGVTDISADGVSVSVSGLSKTYSDLAAQLRAEYAAEGAVGGMPLLDNIMDDSEWDPTIKALEFGMHMHDNYLVGRQNYGGLGHTDHGSNPLLGGA